MAVTQILASDKILRINDEALLGMVQAENWSPNFNAQDIYELGNVGKVGTGLEVELSGSIEVLSIGGLPGILAPDMLGLANFNAVIFDPQINGCFGFALQYDHVVTRIFQFSPKISA